MHISAKRLYVNTVEDWTECAQTHTQTDKSENSIPPVSLRSLGVYNNSAVSLSWLSALTKNFEIRCQLRRCTHHLLNTYLHAVKKITKSTMYYYSACMVCVCVCV